ncbi:TetR family transcriptional regulator [Thalassolituus sp. ST750PaO-4]|jgi:TetR/AcrR family transcriptional repressor of bet genes|uniref:TetR/AcrR family transcriptional regulator n=1 Tax=Thalassolituus sp. ST750PaO-4 TaxID=2742965 RepID=UPI001CE2E904|nr:TetR family transcriptional regulator [Thalassolituus sp. ST750PaO-4]MCA6061756.1 TetR family transcriptional regulator [Thalassolituus sp. ST750PaO-4]
MARPSNTGHRRQEIVNGLMQAMADKGYEKASIQSIAKAAGLSPGLIHYHFKTKQEILIALIHQISEQAAQRFTLLADAAGNAQQQLDAYIDAALALGDGSNPEAVTAWVIIGAEAVRIEEVRALYQQIIRQHSQQLSELLQQAAAENGVTLNPSQTADIAAFVIASIEGSYQLATTAPAANPGYAARLLKQALTGMLQANNS